MARWSVVVPLKSWRAAKSRLVEVPSADRIELAQAMAWDTVSTVLATPGVLECVVVGERATCTELAGSGARLVVEADDAGLVAALHAGAAARHPSAQGTCFLMADLPMLTATDLGRVLSLVPPTGPAVVRDRQGTGTVLLAARGAGPQPQFGVDSAERHLASGAVDLSAVGDALRHDLDVWEDLLSVRPRPGTRTATWMRRFTAADVRSAWALRELTITLAG